MSERKPSCATSATSTRPPKVRLGEVCEIVMGQSPTSESYNKVGDGLPFYQGNADFGYRWPTPRVWCNSPTKMAEPGDILISVRAPIGALNFAKERCCIGRGVAPLQVRQDNDSLLSTLPSNAEPPTSTQEVPVAHSRQSIKKH